MIAERPDIDINGYYSQKQAADVLHVCRHTIMRYEKTGALHFRIRKGTSRKVVSGLNLMKLWKTVI